MNRSILLAAPLVLAVAAAASAQDIPFTKFRDGAFAPAQARTGNTVIRSQAELRQAGLERLMPVGGSFDFTQESLVAVVMEHQSNGGISIGVESIQRRMFGSQPTLEIKVRVRRPGPGMAAPKVTTRPYAIYRTAATTLPARFLDAGPSGPGGGGGLLPPGLMPFHVVNHGNHRSSTLPAGNVVVKSAADLASSGLAALVPNASSINWSAEQLGILVMPQQSGGGTTIAVKRIRRHITPFTTPGGAAGGGLHYEVEYEVIRALHGGGMTTVMSQPFQVVRFSRGRTVFTELNPAPPLLPPGQLPFHVVAEGDQADFNLTSGQFLIRSASELFTSGLSSLVPTPNAIRWDREMVAILLMDVKTRAGYGVAVKKVMQRITPTGGPGGPLGGARHLEIQFETTRPAPSGGFAATVMNRPFQVVRLPRASRAVFKEVSAPATTFSGTVRVQRAFGGVTFVTLQSGSERFYLSPRSFAQSLAPLAGQTVTIDADRNPNVPSFLTAKGLISPEAFSGTGIVQGSASAPTLFHHGQRLPLEGRLASSLGQHAMGRLLEGVEGFRFNDGRLLVTQFQATVRHPATVTMNRRRVNRLQPGEVVTVTGRSRSGKSLIVEPAQGAGGYVTTWRLNLGSSPFVLSPATPSTGVTGALSGASGQ